MTDPAAILRDQKRDRPRIPGGSITLLKARRRWEDVVRTAQDSRDPEATWTAVSRFMGIAETMLMQWERNHANAPPATCPYCEGETETS